MKPGKLTYINGLLLDAAQAHIGIEDLALNRGYGVFDFFRVRDGIPLFPDAHMHRLLHSARQMHLKLDHSEAELINLASNLIEQNCEQECGVKILVTGGYSDNGYSIGTPNIIMSTLDLPAINPDQYQKGISLITHEYRRELPAVKSINYAMGIWLLPEIASAQADDVLYCWEGEVHECPRSNIFIVSRAGEVFTPVSGILHGITRRNVLHISREHFPTHETEVSREMLYDAAEIFITSTTKRILPVTKLDGELVGDGKPGKITQQLMHHFQEMELQYLGEKRAIHQ